MENGQKKIILFMPSIDGGGVEKNLILISDYLAKHLDSIYLITYDNKFNKFFNKKIKIINVTNSNLKESKYYKYFRCLLVLVFQFLRIYDCTVFSFQANVYCAILHKIFKFRLIVRSNSSPSGWSHGFVKKWIFRFFLKSVDNIVVNSDDFKNEFNKILKLKSKKIYNPLNKQEILIKSKEKIKFDFFNDKKALKIINVARFTDQKDHMTLLESFNKISSKINCKLIIMGFGPNRKLIQNFLLKNKLGNKVKILNFQKNPYKYIKLSDLLILTSRYEGLPNVLLEAMCLRVFIISSNCPTGPKEILNNGKYGYLFRVGDSKDLTKKIWDYKKLKNKQNIKKMINLGYKSLKRFNYETNCQKYLSLIQGRKK